MCLNFQDSKFQQKLEGSKSHVNLDSLSLFLPFSVLMLTDVNISVHACTGKIGVFNLGPLRCRRLESQSRNLVCCRLLDAFARWVDDNNNNNNNHNNNSNNVVDGGNNSITLDMESYHNFSVTSFFCIRGLANIT